MTTYPNNAARHAYAAAYDAAAAARLLGDADALQTAQRAVAQCVATLRMEPYYADAP